MKSTRKAINKERIDAESTFREIKSQLNALKEILHHQNCRIEVGKSYKDSTHVVSGKSGELLRRNTVTNDKDKESADKIEPSMGGIENFEARTQKRREKCKWLASKEEFKKKRNDGANEISRSCGEVSNTLGKCIEDWERSGLEGIGGDSSAKERRVFQLDEGPRCEELEVEMRVETPSIGMNLAGHGNAKNWRINTVFGSKNVMQSARQMRGNFYYAERKCDELLVVRNKAVLTTLKGEHMEGKGYRLSWQMKASFGQQQSRKLVMEIVLVDDAVSDTFIWQPPWI